MFSKYARSVSSYGCVLGFGFPTMTAIVQFNISCIRGEIKFPENIIYKNPNQKPRKYLKTNRRYFSA